MIRVERGPEPAALAAARARLLPRVREIWDREGATPALKDALTGYDPGNVVKDTLFAKQHRKCAYCELRQGMKSQPIEHFRPRKEAWRHLPDDGQRHIDHERYWWLCWTWENLLFACGTCNGSGRKGNYFPLHPSSPPLPPKSIDTSVEAPLLLDPSAPGFDVRTHLRWRPVQRTDHPRRWRWQLDSLTPEGRVTRKILGLERLADHVGDHFRRTVWPRFESAVDRLCQRTGVTIRELMAAWDSLCRDLARPEATLAAATWFMLDALRTYRPRLSERNLPPPRWLL